MQRSFGRYFAADERDKDYKVAKIQSRWKRRTWNTGPYSGDQADTPECVGYAWAHWLHCNPIRQWMEPTGIYRLAQHLDEWEGEDYEGTSVRGGAKVLYELGAITEYRWTWDVEVAAAHVLEVGPLVIGVDMYEGMMWPGRGGLMHLTGEVLGGHAMLVYGVDVNKRLFRVKNSWGLDWGIAGCAAIGFDELQVLLDSDGECCCGVERKVDWRE